MKYLQINDAEIINERLIEELIEKTKSFDRIRFNEIIEKAKKAKGLELEEVAFLINIEDPEALEELFEVAREVKLSIYGKRVVFFVPLYTSNECTNNCLYCGYRHDNKILHRKTLTTEDIIKEAKAIESQGHKRILLVCGEDPNKTSIGHITSAVEAIYKNCDIRRINVNAAPMSIDEFKMLKESGIGTYQIFQETYHRETYKKMHPQGQKANYNKRITAIYNAYQGGIDDVGIGPLLGLYDYRFDVLATLMHIRHFDNFTGGVGPHTISVPRLKYAEGWALDGIPYPISDLDFMKIVAVFRLAVPYTGIILSTREAPDLRDKLLDLGVSQISAGSSTSPGGYKEKEEHANQFELADHRNLIQMMNVICEKGYIPSFCTACYRRERTGHKFMEFAKEGEIHEFCQPNAILTFKEVLLDYGTDELKKKGEEIIKKALDEIDNIKLKEETIKRIKELEQGKRDLYF
ncbi:[FeFe] hydrogenase H-cluster radical SAM maturase HydG [Caldicellulosiruptoraceae bacterium PP1]